MGREEREVGEGRGEARRGAKGAGRRGRRAGRRGRRGGAPPRAGRAPAPRPRPQRSPPLSSPRPCARPRKTWRAAGLRARSAERRNGGARERSAARAGSGPAPGAHRSGRAARAAPAAGSAAPAAGRRGAAGVGALSLGRPDGETGRPELPPRAGRDRVGLAEFPDPRASPGLGPTGRSPRRCSDSRRAPGPSLWDAQGGRGSTHEGHQNLRLFSKGSRAPWPPHPQLMLNSAGAVEAPRSPPGDGGGPGKE